MYIRRKRPLFAIPRPDPPFAWWNSFTWAWFEIAEINLAIFKAPIKVRENGVVPRKWREHRGKKYLRTFL